MVVVITKIDALSEKLLELKQTLLALSEATRNEKGCLSHNVLQDLEENNTLSLMEVWESQDELDRHRRSPRFTVLMGTSSLLSGPPEITVSDEISRTTGWEALE